MLAREDAADSEIVIEEVFTMTSVWNTVIDEQLKDYFNGSFAVER